MGAVRATSGADANRVAVVAGALASPARAAMACLLLAGTAHTGRELARHAGIAPSTASEHLARLLEAGLLAVEVQGRHRYYRLADREVAALLETIAATLPEPPTAVGPPSRPVLPARMAFARSCYDHLAGELAVAVYDRLVELEALQVGPGGPTLTEGGVALLADLGVAFQRERSRPLARSCLDWSQRRHHLAGVAGARLLKALLERRWLHRNPGRPRELRLSRIGRDGLRTHLGVDI